MANGWRAGTHCYAWTSGQAASAVTGTPESDHSSEANDTAGGCANMSMRAAPRPAAGMCNGVRILVVGPRSTEMAHFASFQYQLSGDGAVKAGSVQSVR